MRVKKRVRSCLFAFVCSFLLCCSIFCNSFSLNRHQQVENASAYGFSDVTNQPEPTISIEFVYSDNSTHVETYSSDVLDSAFYTPNGFSVFDLILTLSPNGVLDNCISFYLALDFGTVGFNSARYDMFLSSSTCIWSTQALGMQNELLLVSFEDYFLEPMDIFKLSRVSFAGNDGISEVSRFRSVVFRFDGYFFRSMLSMYEQGYYNYYVFAHDPTSEPDFVNAYNQGYDNGFAAGESEGYDEGYDEGYNQGSIDGSASGYDSGYRVGYQDGDVFGYNRGWNEGSSGQGFTNLISAVIDVPVQTFFGLLSFDLLGVNIASVILSIGTLALAIWILKTFVI